MRYYYNEYDMKAAAWIKQLMIDGHIPKGEVDTRSICDVKSHELTGYDQCHFFAGISGWALAFKLARIEGKRSRWSGSCPCPPFSSAGKKKACPVCQGISPLPCPRRTGYFICCDCGHAWFADARHLWPEFWRLISECQPSVVYGEQVASDDGRAWLAGVRASLEIVGYAVGGADTCAAGVGSPQIRQRIYWVADADCGREQRRPSEQPRESLGTDEGPEQFGRRSLSCGLAHSPGRGLGTNRGTSGSAGYSDGGLTSERLADTDGRQCRDGELQPSRQHRQQQEDNCSSRLGDADDEGSQGRRQRGDCPGELSPWSASVALACTDGNSRRVKPGIFPLASGVSGRVVLLRGSGNSIVPQVGAKFIQDHEDARERYDLIG